MKRLAWAAVVAVAASGTIACAQDELPYDAVIASVEGTWDTGTAYRAELRARPEGKTALLIYRIGTGGALTLDLENGDIAWRGAMPVGQTPWLDVAPNGALLLTSGNNAIGRGAWEATLTIIERGPLVVVGGYTYRSYDKLNQYPPIDCDVNLFTGRRVVNDQEGTAPHKGAVPVWDWRPETAEDLDLCPTG